ncbi:DUF4166 domain-containing protein [bacterium]|nr:MAG: DUF4166 domain-containing protein [bacterium]
MSSIYRQALGADFDRLHPKIQERFGLCADSGVAHIGRGTMEKIWHGPAWTLPFLLCGSVRRIMFPEHGENIPFTIRNYPYRDPLGRDTVTWIRDFATRRARRFDAYMVYSETRGRIVDYLGTHQHLAVDLDLSVMPNGGLRIQSGAQRFYEGPIAFSFPMLFSGVAEVCEWFDDETGRFQIEVNVRNSRLGPLFGYRGSFDVEVVPLERMPADLLPRRVERRE